jgi:hypothetical protein
MSANGTAAALSIRCSLWISMATDAVRKQHDAGQQPRTSRASRPLGSKHNPKDPAMTTLFKILGVRAVIAAAAILASSGSALAGDLKVHLTGSEETPPVTTTASGTGTFKIAADKSVSGMIKTTGIEGTMAHVHLGAAGENGPVIIKLTQGGDGVWSVPADTKLTDDQYAAFMAGKLYVNVHSAANKSGEIRGQLKP